MLTANFAGVEVTRSPRHFVHGFFMMVPAPLHCGQGCVVAKNPCVTLTDPNPWQAGQAGAGSPFREPVPAHETHGLSLMKLIVFSEPAAASSRSICIV